MVVRRFQHVQYPQQVVVFVDDEHLPEESTTEDGIKMSGPKTWGIHHAKEYVKVGIWRELIIDPTMDIPTTTEDAW